MEHKTCSHCKQVKPFSEYNKKTTGKNGLQPLCKDCNKKRFKEYYIRNGDAHRKKVREDKRLKIRENRKKIESVKTKCMLCNEHELICLDFHHVGGDKEANISDAVRMWSWERVEKEIEKCVVLCANCHRKVHAGIVKIE